MYLGAALTALTILITLTQLGDIDETLREEIVRDQPGLTGEELDLAMNVARVVFFGVLGLSAAFIGIWIWMAVANNRGRSWARVVAAVLGGLNLAFSALGLVVNAAGPTGPAGPDIEQPAILTILSLVEMGAVAAILILLFQPASTAYYNAVTHQRSITRYGY